MLTKSIQQLLSERILVLDGAMGTMIQRYGLAEDDFRGERFKELPGQQKGNNDLLCLTRPLLRCRWRTIMPNTFAVR